jgi:hypothetical protein
VDAEVDWANDAVSESLVSEKAETGEANDHGMRLRTDVYVYVTPGSCQWLGDEAGLSRDRADDYRPNTVLD